MSTPEIPQPHDSLIRSTLASSENAVSLFQAHLPPALVEALNWEGLRLESGSYVDKDLRHLESDLLYSVPARVSRAGGSGSEVLLHLLFEHQSTSDRWLPLRLLGYMVEIWRRWRKDNPSAEGLPAIVPLVLSQVEGGWRVPVQFMDLLIWPASQREALERYEPRFEHLLIDLAKVSKDQLQGNAAVRLAQGLLKAAMEKELLEWIDWAAPLLQTVDSREFIRVLILYAANAESRLDFREFLAKIESAKIPTAAEAIMSIAEQLRTEGETKGEQRGLERGREEGLERGREEGLERGSLIGQIQALQRVLKRPEIAPIMHDRMDADELRAMIAALERALP